MRLASRFLPLLAFLVLAAAFHPAARAEGITVELPTGGYFRSGQVMPVVVAVETFGNRVEYNITLTPAFGRSGASGAEVILESASVSPRTLKRFTLPVLLDSRTPGLHLSVIDELSMTRDTVFSEDLSPRIRYLAPKERLFLFTGDPSFCSRLMKLAALPDLVVRPVFVPLDSPVFSRWQFLEGVDCVVLALEPGSSLSGASLRALREYLELGGRIVAVSSPAAAASLLEADSLPQPGDPSVRASSPAALVISCGLGLLTALSCSPGDDKQWVSCWTWTASNVSFPAAPVSLLPPEPDARLFEPVVKSFFSPMDMASSYRRTLLFALLSVFLAFLLAAALLYAFGLSGNGLAAFSFFAVAALVLFFLIHGLIPKPGVVWRYRSVIETDGRGRGRMTVFTSLSATSEKTVTLEEEPSGVTKILFSREEAFPLNAPRTRSPAAGWRIRGIPVLPRRPTLLMTAVPLSALRGRIPPFLVPVLSRRASELTIPTGAGFRRRFIQVQGDTICLGPQCIPHDRFVRARETPQGFDPGEWAFLHIACFRCARPDAAGSLYWPLDEPGEMVSSDRIMRIDFRRIGELGATLIFAPAPAEPNERKEQ